MNAYRIPIFITNRASVAAIIQHRDVYGTSCLSSGPKYYTVEIFTWATHDVVVAGTVAVLRGFGARVPRGVDACTGDAVARPEICRGKGSTCIPRYEQNKIISKNINVV